MNIKKTATGTTSHNTTRTGQILTLMHILAWAAFIGFIIEAGTILVSYDVSCVNPEGATDLYKGLNLYDLRHYNFWYYTQHVSFMVVYSFYCLSTV